MKPLILSVTLLIGLYRVAQANEDPIEHIHTAYQQLNPRTRHYSDVRLGPSRTLTKSKKELVKWYASIHHNFPQREIYPILELTFDEVYYTQINQLANDTDLAYQKFVDILRPKWNKLSPKVKEELGGRLGDFGEVFEGPTGGKGSISLPLSIPPNQLPTFTAYYKGTTARQEDRIRVAARMHKNDPDLYVYAKRFFDEEVSKFSGGKSVKEFLIEFYSLADKMKDDSDEEYSNFVDEANKRWHKLDLETKLAFLSQFGFYDNIIVGS